MNTIRFTVRRKLRARKYLIGFASIAGAATMINGIKDCECTARIPYNTRKHRRACGMAGDYIQLRGIGEFIIRRVYRDGPSTAIELLSHGVFKVPKTK